MNNDTENNVRRVAKIWVSLKTNSVKRKLLEFMCKHSRAIYNSGIYFQRQMFYLRKLMIKYYIHNIDDFYNQFSLDDSIYMILEIIKNNTNLSNFELYVCNKPLNNVYPAHTTCVSLRSVHYVHILNKIENKCI